MASSPYSCFSTITLFLSLVLRKGAVGVDPADAFSPLSLQETDFEKQKPYDVPLEQRYSCVDGVRSLWVYSDDKPFKPNSTTKPRTEISLISRSYFSGIWQFEGKVYVPEGTTGVSVMQVFGASPSATTLMLHVYDGDLMYYDDRSKTVAESVYDRWLKLNVIHDIGVGNLEVYVDDERKLVAKGRGGHLHYFKFGVYEQRNNSARMESRWKDVMILSLAGLSISYRMV